MPAEVSSRINPPQDATAAVVAHLGARAGRLLMMHGADTDHAQQRVTGIVHDLGHEAHVFISAEAILLTVGSGSQFRTKVGHQMTGPGVDMTRLMYLEQLLDAVHQQPMAPDVIDARLDVIEHEPVGYSVFLIMLGVAVTAGSLARLFGANWPVVGAAFIAGCCSILVRSLLALQRVNAIASVFVTALVSGLLGTLVLRLEPSASPVLCLTAAGMILVPGVPLINGVRELVDGHAGNGIARLAISALIVLVIGFALLLATTVAGDALPVDAAPGTLPVLEDVLFSALAAIGYALLFNVPMASMWVCILCGALSHGTRTALSSTVLGIAGGSLVGAFVAGVIARLAGRHYRVPAVTFAFPGIVAMIPGSYGFRAGIGGLHLMTLGKGAPLGLIAETLALAITAVVVTIAIAAGLSLALSCGSRACGPH